MKLFRKHIKCSDLYIPENLNINLNVPEFQKQLTEIAILNQVINSDFRFKVSNATETSIRDLLDCEDTTLRENDKIILELRLNNTWNRIHSFIVPAFTEIKIKRR